jgi:sugar phosphate isomerase/epimerase
MKGLVLTSSLCKAYGNNLPALIDKARNNSFSHIELQGLRQYANIDEIIKYARDSGLEISADANLYLADISEKTLSEVISTLEKETRLCQKYGVPHLTFNAQILERDVATTLDKTKAKYTDREVLDAMKNIINDLPRELSDYLLPENSAYYTTGPRAWQEMAEFELPITLDISHVVVNGLDVPEFARNSKIGKVHISDNITRFDEAQLRQKYGANVDGFFAAPDFSGKSYELVKRRDIHLPFGAGCINTEEISWLSRLPSSVPVLHELKDIGLALLGKDLRDLIDTI